SAWWNVLAWTIRNSATFAPVVAALFWPVVKKRAVLASLCTGYITGLSWYYLGGWDPEEFFLNIHPVWMGSSINVLTIIIVTIYDRQATWYLKKPYALIYLSARGWLLVTFVNIWNFKIVYENGVFGLFLFAAVVFFFIVTLRMFNYKEERKIYLLVASNM